LLDLRRRHRHRVVDVVLVGESSHDVYAGLVLGDADDLQRVLVLLLQRDQVGDLGAAGTAPGGPEVDDDDFAAQRRGRDLASVEILQVEHRRRLWIAEETQRDSLAAGSGRFRRGIRGYGLPVLHLTRVARRGPRQEDAAEREDKDEGTPFVHGWDKCKLK